MNGGRMSPDTIESVFIGLTLAVLAVLASAVTTHIHSAWLWANHGFDAGEEHGRKAASVFIFTGLLLYGGFQMVSRSRVDPVPAGYLQSIGLVAWSLFGYGAVVWQSSVMAGKSRKVARIYLWGMILTAGVCMASVGLLRPFHAVTVAAPIKCAAP